MGRLKMKVAFIIQRDEEAEIWKRMKISSCEMWIQQRGIYLQYFKTSDIFTFQTYYFKMNLNCAL